VTYRRFRGRQEVTAARRNNRAAGAQAYKRAMAIHTKGAAMNRNKMLVLAVLAAAGLSGCATARSDLAAAEAAAPAAAQVSKPAASYGSMGGYRYRRLVTVKIASST
jgi:uncharacterized protein YceK